MKGPTRQKQDRKNIVRKRRVVGRIHRDRNRHKNRIKKSGKDRLVYVKKNMRNMTKEAAGNL